VLLCGCSLDDSGLSTPGVRVFDASADLLKDTRDVNTVSADTRPQLAEVAAGAAADAGDLPQTNADVAAGSGGHAGDAPGSGGAAGAGGREAEGGEAGTRDRTGNGGAIGSWDAPSLDAPAGTGGATGTGGRTETGSGGGVIGSGGNGGGGSGGNGGGGSGSGGSGMDASANADGDGDEHTDTGQDLCAQISHLYDFESGASGFAHAATSGVARDDPWERGDTTKGGGCHSGRACWATGLSEPYSRCQTAELVSPTIDLSACSGSAMPVEVSFWHWYRFEEFSNRSWWDGGAIQFSANNGAQWDDVTPTPEYQGPIDGNYSGCARTVAINTRFGWSGLVPGGAWVQVTVPVAEVHRTRWFRFRFLFGSDTNITAPGWVIDDVAVRSY